MPDTLPLAGAPTKRLGYLDNVRSFVIFLVVVTHTVVTYSGYGGWYYKEGMPDRLDLASRVLFGLYGSFTQAWFMGALFFLAAFFAARSLTKRGPGAFVRERLFRLGVPLLIYMFVIDPFIGYFLMDYGGVRERLSVLQAYGDYLASFRWVGSTGPLWFVEALLFFSLPYAAWRAIRPAKKNAGDPPRVITVILIIVATGLAAFSIRLFQPIGTSVANLQLCYFAAYIALFLCGLHAGERRWLENFPRGITWFAVALSVGVPLWFVIMVGGGAAHGATLFNGGLQWESFAFAFWESFVAIGFSLGLIAFFRKNLNVENAFTRLLAQNSFGIYMFHAPVLITISLFLRSWDSPALLKAAVVAPLAFTATLALSFLVLRRIPGLRSVLK
ncbi:MAG TPA: acyltransferase [Spirochaetia bacterium]|nr:acyltransferase [Spirochaetia bacterium]